MDDLIFIENVPVLWLLRTLRLMLGCQIIIFVQFRINDFVQQQRCPGARSFIAVGTVLAILIMSWLEAFASGLFALIYARRDCFAEGELLQTFCGAVGVCLSLSIRCDVELVWSCYVSCMAWAVGGVLIVLRWKLYYI